MPVEGGEPGPVAAVTPPVGLLAPRSRTSETNAAAAAACKPKRAKRNESAVTMPTPRVAVALRSMLALCPPTPTLFAGTFASPPARSRFSSPPGAASGDPGDPGGTCGGAASGDCPSPAPSAAGIDAADGQSLHVVLFEGWVEPNSCSTLGHPRPCPRGHPGPRDPPPGLPWGYPRGYPLSSGTSPG